MVCSGRAVPWIFALLVAVSALKVQGQEPDIDNPLRLSLSDTSAQGRGQPQGRDQIATFAEPHNDQVTPVAAPRVIGPPIIAPPAIVPSIIGPPTFAPRIDSPCVAAPLAGLAPAADLKIIAPSANDAQINILPAGAATADSASSTSRVIPASMTGEADRLAQNPIGPEIIRPSVPANPSAQPSAPPATTEPADRFQGLLPVAGPPPVLGPVPTPEVQRDYAQFADGQITPKDTIEVVVGRAVVKVLSAKPRRIFMPNEDYAIYQVVTDQQIAIVGKKGGRTVLDLWFPDPNNPNDPSKDRALSYMIVVLPDTGQSDLMRWQERRRMEAELDSYRKALKVLEVQIKEAFPDSAVQLTMVGEQVVVRGEAKDVVDAAQILGIVAEHAPVGTRRRGIGSAGGNTGLGSNANVNLLLGTGHEEAIGGLENALQAQRPGLNLSLNAGPGQEQAAINAIREILQGSPHIIDLLRVPGEQQVMLMVTVAEVNRTAARTIGMDFSITNGGLAFAQNTGQGLNVGTATAGSVTGATGISAAAQALRDVGGNLPTAIDNGNVLMAIQALRTINFARSLAEPNLTTMNGKPATFLAGGSFPIPNSIVLPGGAAQSVTYQNFGVSLQFVPFVTDRTRIRLQLNASVSTPSTATTQVSGAAVPSQITQRQFQTTVELREGQTLTVAGLIQNNFSGQSNRVPLWGDLPIIGRTGGVDSVSSGEQELVVLVTPVLVHPLEQCQTPPLPGNDIFEPGDVEFYLLGHMEGRRTQDYRASVRSDYARQRRFEHCDDEFIIGPHGPTYGCCNLGNCPCARPAAGGSAPVQVPQAELVPTPMPKPQT
jgi:pilus assembly protein CpaC